MTSFEADWLCFIEFTLLESDWCCLIGTTSFDTVWLQISSFESDWLCLIGMTWFECDWPGLTKMTSFDAVDYKSLHLSQITVSGVILIRQNQSNSHEDICSQTVCIQWSHFCLTVSISLIWRRLFVVKYNINITQSNSFQLHRQHGTMIPMLVFLISKA